MLSSTFEIIVSFIFILLSFSEQVSRSVLNTENQNIPSNFRVNSTTAPQQVSSQEVGQEGPLRSDCFSTNEDSFLSREGAPDLFDTSDFSLSLFKTIVQQPGSQRKNVFLSPYSIWSSLSLVYLGSEGDTKKQLEDVLRMGSKVSMLKKSRALEYLYKIRQLSSKDYIFDVVNRAFFDVRSTMTKCAVQILNTELRPIDFQNAVSAASTINHLISNSTKGKIERVVSPEDLEDAQMALVNAAYFKDSWRRPFKKALTKKDIFYTFDGHTFVEYMHQKGVFRHGISEELGCHILEIPYSMKDISFYILLPPFVLGEKGFNRVIQSLNKEELDIAVRHVGADEVELSLPKFKIESSLGKDLMTALETLGLTDLFDPSKANLSTFVPQGDVSITSTLHKAFLEVDEEGTEAAASSVVIGTGRSARPIAPPIFDCNHPFVYLILDNLTRNILFIGTYKGPT